MAEITREHLELAALAAGHTITSFEPVGPRGALVAMLGVNAAGYGIHWRPHLDDGDAARLAVRLGLTIEIGSRIVVAFPCHVAHDGTEPDKLRAWREAVVLCAAAVGERMRGER